jgi:hypothetical protein
MVTLPMELVNMILYRYGGLEHPTAKIMKEFIAMADGAMKRHYECKGVMYEGEDEDEGLYTIPWEQYRLECFSKWADYGSIWSRKMNLIDNDIDSYHMTMGMRDLLERGDTEGAITYHASHRYESWNSGAWKRGMVANDDLYELRRGHILRVIELLKSL